jgi:hypothetical protein
MVIGSLELSRTTTHQPRVHRAGARSAGRTDAASQCYNDYIVACDGEVDGHYVYANYHLVNAAGYSSYRNVVDDNGANNGCEAADWQATPYWARAMRICEQDSTCSAWVYIPNAVSVSGKQAPAAAPR